MARERNITTLSNLEIVPDSDDPLSPDNGLYPPRLSQAQVDNVDVRSDSRGCLAYNTTTGSLQMVNKDSDWVDVGVEATGDFDTLNVTDLVNVGPLGSPTVTLDGALGAVNAIDIIAQDSISAPYIIAGENTNYLGMFAGLVAPGGNAPYTVTLGPGAGSGTSPAPSYTMKGSLVSGTFNVQVGSILPPVATQIIATFTIPSQFNTLFNGPCSIIFAPNNVFSGGRPLRPWIELDTSGPSYVFRLWNSSSPNSVLAQSVIYSYAYTIIGNIQGV